MPTASHDRRTLLQVSGVTIATALAAGCLGGDDDDDVDETNDEGDEEFEIDPDTEIVLDGYATHWDGIEPAEIEGIENPTLVLTEGEEYSIEWINADDMPHDLQIWDADDDPVDDLVTDEIGEEGEGDSLTFTADPEMVTYVCSLHEQNQIGDLVVE